MKSHLRQWGRRLMDPVAALFAVAASPILRSIRAFGLEHLPLTRTAFEAMGFLPVQRHYYEPLFHPDDLRGPLSLPRKLPGLDLRPDAQLRILQDFKYQSELTRFSVERSETGAFYYNNGYFESGDAELWYSMIRHLKPSTVVEVGSGMSTRLARRALAANGKQHRHLCIEPYEAPWLEAEGIEVVRKRVEEVEFEVFESLGEGDILFIDSSHVIRPQGDVLFLFLEVLPCLRPGVVVHVHDIFTPRDYPAPWVLHAKRLWNEQYLVEALLSGSDSFEVLLAANYLAHSHQRALAAIAPVYAQQAAYREPGSLYIRRHTRDA